MIFVGLSPLVKVAIKLLSGTLRTGFEPIIANNVQKINFKFTMISIFTTLLNLNT